MSVYNSRFYADQVEDSARSARAVLPLVFAAGRPRSVIDVGCGQGAWLAVAEELGVEDLTGLDGAWVDRAALRSKRMVFRAADLTKPVEIERRRDLCISVEVAEHLPQASADDFVRTLSAASDLVLFSAAVPLQGGTDHVYEARASAWITRFDAQGYECFDLVRGALWENADVAWWYRQNVLVFAKKGSDAHARVRALPAPPAPRDLVHPEAFESKLRWLQNERDRLDRWVERPSIGQALRGVARALFGRRD